MIYKLIMLLFSNTKNSKRVVINDLLIF